MKPRQLVTVSLLAAIIFLSVSCGKRKPPLPPVEKIPQKTDQLTGYQQGNNIILQWPAPKRNAPDSSLQSIRRMDVYRLAESPDAPLPLNEDEFSARSVLIGSVAYKEILQFNNNIKYVDTIEQIKQLVRFRYAVRYVNSTGSSASFSNFLLIEPTTNVSIPPTIISKEETENSIIIKWNTPQQNTDGSTPANLMGFNVYREFADNLSAINQEPIQLNSKPLNTDSFSDTNFKFGDRYKYFIRAVSLGNDGNPVESLDSNEIFVNPKDIYSPSSPTAISLAASTGRISIFFPNNPEKDIAGYLIYRSTEQNLPLKNWTKITPDIITRTTFQDNNVVIGIRYFYYIIAVDTSGNLSNPSEVVSEIVP